MGGRIIFQIISYVTLLTFIVGQGNDFYTSVSGLEDLADTEFSLIDNLQNYILEKKDKLLIVNRFLESFQKEHQKGLNSIEDYLSNPINGYMIIKRLTKDWDEFFDLIADAAEESKYLNIVNDLMEQSTYAMEDDLKGAALGLGRLQKIYKLTTSELANGTIYGKNYSNGLSADDCYQIGVELFKKEDFKLAAEWFNQTLIKIETENVVDSVLKVDYGQFVEHYLKTLENIGNLDLAVVLFNKLKALQNDTGVEDIENQTYIETKAFNDRNNLQRKYLQQAAIQNSNSDPSLTELYEKTCRRELVRSPSEERHLQCRYVTNKNSFNKLAPFKYEEISLDPYVVLYHDVIYQNEINSLIETAEPIMVRSKVGAAGVFSEIRISKQAWLFPHEHSFLKPILKRLDDITGLDLLGAEALQVANYGIGGQYEPHFDFFQYGDVNEEAGNRIATAMFYIGEVEQGGATAFPFLKIAVPPIQGSLLFWFNLHESLEPDYRTKHAGCPVLIGSKWIVNEWYHERNQEFNRPCCLNKLGGISAKYEHYI